MRTFLIIVRFTVLEILQSNLLYGVIALALGSALFAYLSSLFTYGVPVRVALDVGIGSMGISGIGIALFYGATLLSKEIENRTIYISLVRPISRREFITAKLSGLLIVLALNILILSIFTLSVFFILGGQFNLMILWSIVYSFLESALLMLVVVLASLFLNLTLTIILGITIYGAGYILASTLVNYFTTHNMILSWVTKVLTTFIPDFSRLNIKEYLLYQQNLDSSFLWGSLAYASIYSFLVFLLIVMIFRKKELL